MSRIRAEVLVAPLLCVWPSVHAEPGRVQTWLMNEPVSLFDWGIYNTNKKIEELKTSNKTFSLEFFFGSASYDWDANRIRLRVHLIGKGTEAECIDNIKRAKGAFLNYTWNEREQVQTARKVFASLFSHEGGYTSKKEPPDLGEQLASISELEATIYIPDATGFAPSARCRMDFKSSDVSIVKQQ